MKGKKIWTSDELMSKRSSPLGFEGILYKIVTHGNFLQMSHDERQGLLKYLPYMDRTTEALPEGLCRQELLKQMGTFQDILRAGQFEPGVSDQIRTIMQEQEAEQKNEYNEEIKLFQRTDHPQQEGEPEPETDTKEKEKEKKRKEEEATRTVRGDTSKGEREKEGKRREERKEPEQIGVVKRRRKEGDQKEEAEKRKEREGMGETEKQGNVREESNKDQGYGQRKGCELLGGVSAGERIYVGIIFGNYMNKWSRDGVEEVRCDRRSVLGNPFLMGVDGRDDRERDNVCNVMRN
jgi:hypothetical protein